MMTVLDQAAHDVAAHSAEADHAELHQVLTPGC
jgi:hypothetical protein